MLMQFADINSDMFTDIITVDKSMTTVVIHIFDSVNNNFSQKISFKPEGCSKIKNVSIGRSDKTLRLFVTCKEGGVTVVKMYDRNMNGEMAERAKEGVNKAGEEKDTVDKIVDTIISNNNMVYK